MQMLQPDPMSVQRQQCASRMIEATGRAPIFLYAIGPDVFEQDRMLQDILAQYPVPHNAGARLRKMFLKLHTALLDQCIHTYRCYRQGTIPPWYKIRLICLARASNHCYWSQFGQIPMPAEIFRVICEYVVGK